MMLHSLMDVTADVIVGVNKYRLAHEEKVEVRSIDNEAVRNSQVHPSSHIPSY